jgi:hypothetical protein
MRPEPVTWSRRTVQGVPPVRAVHLVSPKQHKMHAVGRVRAGDDSF